MFSTSFKQDALSMPQYVPHAPVAIIGYEPSNDEKEERAPITVLVNKNNILQDQDPIVFDRVNELAKELHITENGTPIVNFYNGFRTIKDYITFTTLQNRTPDNILVFKSHALTGDKNPLKFLKNIYEGKRNKNTVDLSGVFSVLNNLGFIRVCNATENLEYIKFNELNIPCELLEISLRGSKLCTLLTGMVKHDTYNLLEDAFKDNLEPIKEKTTLHQLNSFIEVSKDNFKGDFTSLQLVDEMDYALPEFYPWVKMGLRDYFKEFLESRSNVLVLIGPPGTGKSTLIRTIIRDLNVRSMLAYKPDVVASPHFIKTCQDFLARDYTDGELHKARFTYEKLSPLRRHKAVVVEDADLIMSKRADGNHRMSEILNATSGIASDMHSKFILSTNLKNVDDIDPALLRPGRCFDVLCFRDLSAEESTLVRSARGMPPREFASNRRYKLAEVLTNTITQHQVEPIVKPRFGFSI